MSDENIDRLHEALAPFIEAARSVNGRPTKTATKALTNPRRTRPAVDREQSQAIREWANANGHTVAGRGRIPAAVVDAYNAAH